MNELSSVEIKRKHISDKRISPARVNNYNLVIHYDGRQQWVPERKHTDESELPVPKNIYIYISERQQNHSHNKSAALAEWNIEGWLKYALGRWADEEIIVKFVSFDYALIKCDFLSKLDILKSNKHNWKIHLLSDGKEFANIALLDELLKAAFDCIEIFLCEVEANEVGNRTFEAIKNLIELRKSRKQDKPTVIFKCIVDEAENTHIRNNLMQWARQTDLDEFAIITRQSEECKIWDL